MYLNNSNIYINFIINTNLWSSTIDDIYSFIFIAIIKRYLIYYKLKIHKTQVTLCVSKETFVYK